MAVTRRGQRGQVEQHLSLKGRAGSKAHRCDNSWFRKDWRSTGGEESEREGGCSGWRSYRFENFKAKQTKKEGRGSMILSGAEQQLCLMSPINKPCAWTPPPTRTASHQHGLGWTESTETQEAMPHVLQEMCGCIYLCLKVGLSLISVGGIMIFHNKK